MFTKLYLQTTDPKMTFSEMIGQNIGPIIISTIFHTIVYTLFINLANFIFFGKILSRQINTRVIITLLLIMSLGYIGRYYHTKDIYNAYHNDIDKTRNHLDKLYITWIFIA